MKHSEIPKVQRIAQRPELSDFVEPVRTAIARRVAAALRASTVETAIEETLIDEIALFRDGSLRPAINMTGIVLHTGLGRARLSPFAAQRVAAVAAGHSTLEIDLLSGRRGDRQAHVASLLTGLTGAEAALAVNNCAAALLLVLRALAAGREVILSRGQMVEIGGSFRMPEIVAEAGCRLIEVGCTNKTRLQDYEAAIGPETVAVLRCHPSNYRIVGFVEEPSPAELAQLCQDKGLLLIDDVGSGLVDQDLALEGVESLAEACRHADVVVASGDKMLGGPQAGLILGRIDLLGEVSRHPLARAVRIDKLCLAGLEATLQQVAYGDGDRPTRLAILRDLDDLRTASERLAEAWRDAEVVANSSSVGGGSAPGQTFDSYAAALRTKRPDDLAHRLRLHRPAIVGRVAQQSVLLDPRCATDEELDVVVEALKELRAEFASG